MKTHVKIKLSREDKLALRRLRKLAAHIRNPKKRGLDRFDFDYVATENSCGTKGCAIGELPFCFPRHFKHGESTLSGKLCGVFMKHHHPINIFMDVRNFFRLSQVQRETLFVPQTDVTEYCVPGLRRLGKRAQAKSVAKNIEKFCELVESGAETLGEKEATL